MSTFNDKDRRRPMLEDGRWHGLTILDQHGDEVPGVTPDEGPGRYLMQMQIRGDNLQTPSSELELYAERYPYSEVDHGTAWDRIVIATRSRWVEPDHWFGTRHAIVSIYPAGHGYSEAVGVSYRVEGGRLVCTDLVLKLERIGELP